MNSKFQEQHSHLEKPSLSANSCNHCREPFNRNERIPKVLNCGHFFCLTCFLTFYWPEQLQTVVTCFTCKRTTTIKGGVEKLPTYASALPFTLRHTIVEAHLADTNVSLTSVEVVKHLRISMGTGCDMYNDKFDMDKHLYSPEVAAARHWITRFLADLENVKNEDQPEKSLQTKLWPWPYWCRKPQDFPISVNNSKQLHGLRECLIHQVPQDRWCTKCQELVCRVCILSPPHFEEPFESVHTFFDIDDLQKRINQQKVMQAEVDFAAFGMFLTNIVKYFDGLNMQPFHDFFDFEFKTQIDSPIQLPHFASQENFFSKLDYVDSLRKHLGSMSFPNELTEHFLQYSDKAVNDYNFMRSAVEMVYQDREMVWGKGMDALVMLMSYLLQQLYNEFQEALKTSASTEDSYECDVNSEEDSLQSGENASPDGVKLMCESDKDEQTTPISDKPTEAAKIYLHVRPEMRRSIYYLDFKIGNKKLERVLIETFPAVAPLMSANFAVLCSGTRSKKSFKGCEVFQCWNEQSIITGDITAANNGHRGYSILNNGLFNPDESDLPCNRGAVGMRRVSTKRGYCKGKVSSQFRIVLNDETIRSAIFGYVVQGIETVDEISALDDGKGYPKKKAIIARCGRDE